MMTAVVELPQFRTLVLRVPLPQRITEGIHTLLGPRFFLVAPGAAKSSIESAFGQSIQQRACLQEAAARLGAQRVRIRAVCQRFAISEIGRARVGKECRSRRAPYA